MVGVVGAEGVDGQDIHFTTITPESVRRVDKRSEKPETIEPLWGKG